VSLLLGVALDGGQVTRLSAEAITLEFLMRLAESLGWKESSESLNEELLSRVDDYITEVVGGRVVEIESIHEAEIAVKRYLDEPTSEKWVEVEEKVSGLIRREEAIVTLILYYWYVYLIPQPQVFRFRNSPVDATSMSQSSILDEFCVPARHISILTLSPFTVHGQTLIEDSVTCAALQSSVLSDMALGITWIDLLLEGTSHCVSV